MQAEGSMGQPMFEQSDDMGVMEMQMQHPEQFFAHYDDVNQAASNQTGEANTVNKRNKLASREQTESAIAEKNGRATPLNRKNQNNIWP